MVKRDVRQEVNRHMVVANLIRCQNRCQTGSKQKNGRF